MNGPGSDSPAPRRARAGELSLPGLADGGFRGSCLDTDEACSPFGEASGILRARPRAVAVPEDAADAAALVRWAAATDSPLVPRGAGTGMPGGNVGAGVSVDLRSSFRALGPVDTANRVVRIGPGVTLSELNAHCRPTGLHFPVDPSSGERCSLGGMLANNSGGAHTVKSGSTRRWVRALDVVLADGTVARAERGVRPSEGPLAAIGGEIDALLAPHHDLVRARWPRVSKNSSGYALLEYLESGDLVDLLVGSEGTLALLVGAELALAPVVPERGVALIEFATLEAAGEAVLAIVAEGPSACEMLDRTFLELVREGGELHFPLDPGLEAVLLVEMEGESEAEVREGLSRVERVVAGRAARVSIAVDPEEQHRFWEIRHAASPIIARRSRERVSMQFIEDGVVPLDRIPDYVRMLRRVLGEHSLPHVIFGHAGDGNLHVNPLVDVHALDWRETLESVLHQVAGEVARLGGTLSGEHGDGRLRAPYLETIWGPELVALFRGVKRIFDPRGVLNPGVILPLPGQRPFDALRLFPASTEPVR